MGKKIFSNRLNFLLLVVVVQIFLSFGSTAFSAMHISPSSIIKLPENENVILVEKKTQTLFLYIFKDKTLFVQFQAPCSTGEASGIKQEAGDKKTPEGIYFLYDEYEDKYLSPIYGTKAFPTDYPNFIDKKAGKNGSAIWIHGTNKKLKPMDSNGCIAMENHSILKLSDYVSLHSTPVIIVDEIDKIDGETLIKQEKNISLLLNQWIKAIENGSYHDYLSFYSSEYLPDITWWEQWLEIRKTANKPDSSLRVKRDRTGIYYHNHVFVVLFDYFLVFENKKILLGKRELFLENKNSNYQIIGDTFQKIKVPLVAAAKTLIKPTSKKESVIESINQWLAAWSAKDMDKYASFYANNFYSDGMNKRKWVKKKRMIAKKYNFINISGSEFKVKKKDKTCEVTFFQKYESSGYTAQGTKRLKLVNEGGLWKIYQESWKKR
ncbi:MAG: L,D-transpeptidase family protein [Desulfobacula sp.]|uniref:L,D-transpeptidase family protein n=1 Tax=Desulfobacula sp. TaxID=2593537 RepID=UPI0025C702B0|nr:L,D-transpeptidase family protein [Desulfobacula sp.]MCD4721791.1 L,D-transpeptidase family protein [Desulfobacula sp.]